MNKAVLTIAILLFAVSADADNHRENNNGNHYGQYREHYSTRDHECRNERWRYRTDASRSKYRWGREIPVKQVIFLPEQRITEPQVTISVQTPGLILSFFRGR